MREADRRELGGFRSGFSWPLPVPSPRRRRPRAGRGAEQRSRSTASLSSCDLSASLGLPVSWVFDFCFCVCVKAGQYCAVPPLFHKIRVNLPLARVNCRIARSKGDLRMLRSFTVSLCQSANDTITRVMCLMIQI